MLFLAPFALAAEPALLPLTVDPVVGDHVVRTGLVGDATTAGSIDGSLLLEAAIKSRVAVQVRAGLTLGEEEPTLSGELRGELLDEDDAPIALGATARYKREGFTGEGGEVEGTVAVGRHLGDVHLLGNITGGKELDAQGGDVEGAIAGTYGIGDLVRVGLDARARMELEGDEENEEEREGERRWDARAGALVGVGNDRVSGYVFGGVAAAEEVVGGVGSIGVQVGF